ncbi:MAG: DUF4062 domain-containing protein [Limisphaerales bacterium]
MAQFNKRKLQVFISSTYEDLKEERQAAVEAVLKAGHIPAGMELFSSGNESQMQVIQQWINESDVFLLILGGRYGTIDPQTNKSYIHLEYEYAIEKNKPHFSCVINDSALDDKVKRDGRTSLELKNQTEYEAFRKIVSSNVVDFWSDLKDIKLAISNKLNEYERDDNLTGWVRPETQINTVTLTNSIAKLTQDNIELRKQASNNIGESINGIPIDEWEILLAKADLKNAFSNGTRIDLSSVPKEKLRVLIGYSLVEEEENMSPYSNQRMYLTKAGETLCHRMYARKIREDSEHQNRLRALMLRVQPPASPAPLKSIPSS